MRDNRLRWFGRFTTESDSKLVAMEVNVERNRVKKT